MIRTVQIDNIAVTFAPYDVLMEKIKEHLHRSAKPMIIGYANAHTVNLCQTNEYYRKVLNEQELTYADGAGIHLGARFLGTAVSGFAKNYNASDFNEQILQFASYHRFGVYFLGSTQSSLDRLSKVLSIRYQGIRISGMTDGFDGLKNANLFHVINASGADILLVGMGQPKQEEWLHANRSILTIPVCMSVGAFLDFISGEKIRAPRFVRAVRMEWLFRLLQEPRRLWKRYIIGIPKFIMLIIRIKFN